MFSNIFKNENFIRNLFQVSYKFHSGYLKFPKNFLKISATFIPENFPEISTNFSKNFLKNLVSISIKFYFIIAQILVVLYPKFQEYFLLFVEFINFH